MRYRPYNSSFGCEYLLSCSLNVMDPNSTGSSPFSVIWDNIHLCEGAKLNRVV